jgi:hypothetical protein
MAKQKISNLPSAATLTGAEVVVVNQGGVTKRSTVTNVQTIPLAAAAAAQSTADGKLSTVAVDGTTITGNGTVGNPLVAAGGSNFKEYRGYLTITGGSTVSFTSLKNDVGEVVWTVHSNGQLRGTLTSAFLAAKFFGMVGNLNASNTPYINVVRRLNDNVIIVDLFPHEGTIIGTPNGTFAIQLIINN